MRALTVLSARGAEGLEMGDKPLFSGGTGNVFEVPARSDKLAKLYHTAAIAAGRRVKVEAMLSNPPRYCLGVQPEGPVRFAWPEALLNDDGGEFVGFLMARATGAVSLSALLYDEGRDYDEYRGSRSIRARITVAHNIALGIAELHSRGHLLVDVKPPNILVYRDSLDVCFVDCDGYGISSSLDVYFGPEEMTDAYAAPELLTPVRSLPKNRYDLYPDRFALGALIFELLARVHPYAGSLTRDDLELTAYSERIAAGLYPYTGSPAIPSQPPGESDFKYLPTRLQAMLSNAVGIGVPELRPNAADWAKALREAADSIAVCRKPNSTVLHEWFDGGEGPECATSHVLSRPPPVEPPGPKPDSWPVVVSPVDDWRPQQLPGVVMVAFVLLLVSLLLQA